MSWTITPSFYKSKRIKHGLGGDWMVVVKIACTSDASGGSLTMKSRQLDPSNSYIAFMDEIQGSWLYLMKVVPGSGDDAPSGTFNIDIEDETAAHILDTDANASDATTFHTGSDTLGVYPVIFDHLGVEIATLGNGNKADIYLYFLK